MKITDLALLSIFILFPFYLSVELSQARQARIQQNKSEHTQMLRLSCEDAAAKLIEPGTNFTGISESGVPEAYSTGFQSERYGYSLSVEEAGKQFFKTLYLNMGIENNILLQQAMYSYIPFLLVIGYDGYYVFGRSEYIDQLSGQKRAEYSWTPKIPYSYYDKNSHMVLNFTLDDYVCLYNTGTGQYKSGIRSDFQILYGSKLFEEDYFDLLRKQVIIDKLKKELEYRSSLANNAARLKGISYSFSIPYISDDTWNNTIKGPGFLSFFQGIQLEGINGTYDAIGFAGTAIKPNKKIYACSDNEAAFYHLEGCSHIVNDFQLFHNAKTAAKNGFMPCPYCRP